MENIHKRLLTVDTIIFLLVVMLVYGSIFGSIAYQKSLAPPQTLFPYAGGFLPDFYQYLGWVYDGTMGKLLLTTRYTDVLYARVFIHPFFPIIGFIGSIVRLSPYDSYLVSRLLSTGMFLLAFYLLVRACITNSAIRSLALVLFLSFSGFWTIDNTKQVFGVQEFIPWSGNFNVLYKFNLPPHHFLALSALLLSIRIFHTKRVNPASLLTLAILVLSIGFLNPSILAIVLVIWISSFILRFTPHGKTLIPLQKSLLVCILVAGLVLLYHMILFRTVLPWSIMYERMKQFDPPSTMISYVLALGPMVFLGLFAYKSSYKNHASSLLLFLWAYIPLVLFALKGLFLPINGSRLFQSYQYIPLSILASMGTEYLVQLLKIRRRLFACIVIGGVSLLYGLIPFFTTVRSYAQSVSPQWFNVYIPKPLVDTFSFLSISAPKESVVLAGEYVSQMIPAFSHNRTILARDDVTWDYEARRSKTIAFLNGSLSPDEAKLFLKRYRVSYVLYGIDAPTFSQSPSSYTSFLKVVYSNELITLIRTIL